MSGGSARSADVGLIRRDPIDSPWLDIIANIVIANPTEPARCYFAAVENFIRHFAGRDKAIKINPVDAPSFDLDQAYYWGCKSMTNRRSHSKS